MAAAVTDHQQVGWYQNMQQRGPRRSPRLCGLAAAVTDSAGLTQWLVTASRLVLKPVPRLSKDIETQSEVKSEE